MVGQDELVSRAKKGDAAAAQVLVEGSWDTVCRYAMRLGVLPREAEDLAQEVFLRAFRSIDSFAAGTNFRAWLLRIATNCFIDGARRRASRPEVEMGEPGLHAGVQQNPGNAAELQELEGAVNHALQSLPETERAVLVLRAYEGLSHRDIARAVGKSEATVRWHLHQARKRLRELLAVFL